LYCLSFALKWGHRSELHVEPAHGRTLNTVVTVRCNVTTNQQYALPLELPLMVKLPVTISIPCPVRRKTEVAVDADDRIYVVSWSATVRPRAAEL